MTKKVLDRLVLENDHIIDLEKSNKRKRKIIEQNRTEFIVSLFCLVCFMWIFLSYWQVLAHNLTLNTYSWWNAFTILDKYL